MQNFVYLIGDPVARECVVVDPAWEIDTIVDTAQADGMRLTAVKTAAASRRSSSVTRQQLGNKSVEALVLDLARRPPGR